jgi:hypothetical protein
MKRLFAVILFWGTLLCWSNCGVSKIRAVVTASFKKTKQSVDTVIAVEGSNVYEYKVDDAFNFKKKKVIGKQAMGRLGWKIEDDHHFIYYDYLEADFPQHYFYNDSVVVLFEGDKKDTVARIKDSTLVRDDTVEMNNSGQRAITTWNWSGNSIRTNHVLVDRTGKRTSDSSSFDERVYGIAPRAIVPLLETATFYGRHVPASQEVYFQRMNQKGLGKVFWQTITNDVR